jgi:predicted nucleic acid-binding Zn ribbon protein
MRRTGEIAISDLLKDFINKNRLNNGIDKSRIPEIWNSVCGKYIAESTKSVKVENSKLFVKIQSSILRNEVILIKSELVRRINHELGKQFINDIIVR